jgi:hypothetical protein
LTWYEPLNTLKQVAPNLWVVDGPDIRFFRMPFPTRMTVIRLRNSDLFLHSGRQHSDSLACAVAASGLVRHLVSPNWMHYASISQWANAFPEAIAWASPNVQTRAAKAGITVHFDRNLSELPAPDWIADIDQLIVHGSRVHEEVVFFHRDSATLILADLIENVEAAHPERGGAEDVGVETQAGMASGLGLPIVEMFQRQNWLSVHGRTVPSVDGGAEL